jgi:1-acyl-sn-glycerol-3-phosphate acyltransferase
VFSASYLVYVLLVMAPVQQLVLRPLIHFLPARRKTLLGSWLMHQARVVLELARALAGVRFFIEGGIAKAACVVIMNHQSVLDVPLGVSLVPGPYPLIPTRASYRRGLPGISTLMRMLGCPFLSQGSQVTRAELVSLLRAADQVGRGEQSFLTFPEGHRSPDGEMLPFMTPGLRLVLERARGRPVYAVVVDGLHHLRAFKEIALRLAGTRVRVVVLGPYTIPPEDFQLGGFIDMVRDRMVETLARMRSAREASHVLAANSH